MMKSFNALVAFQNMRDVAATSMPDHPQFLKSISAPRSKNSVKKQENFEIIDRDHNKLIENKLASSDSVFSSFDESNPISYLKYSRKFENMIHEMREILSHEKDKMAEVPIKLGGRNAALMTQESAMNLMNLVKKEVAIGKQ